MNNATQNTSLNRSDIPNSRPHHEIKDNPISGFVIRTREMRRNGRRNLDWFYF